MIVDDSEDLESDSDDDLQRAVEDIFGGSDCTSELSGSDPDQRGMLTVTITCMQSLIVDV